MSTRSINLSFYPANDVSFHEDTSLFCLCNGCRHAVGVCLCAVARATWCRRIRLTTSFYADKVSVDNFNLIAKRAAVTNDGEFTAVLDALGCSKFLELLLFASLFCEQTIYIDRTCSIFKVEVAVLVAIFKSLYGTGELIPYAGALSCCIKVGNGDGLDLIFTAWGRCGAAALSVNRYDIGVALRGFRRVALVVDHLAADDNYVAVLDIGVSVL